MTTKTTKIPFDAAHADEVTAACREVEGRATARRFWWQWGEAGLAEVEEALEHLPKKYRTGAYAWLESSNRVPNSYGYNAQATYVQIVWRGGGWVLGEVKRDYAKSTSYGKSTGRHVQRIWITAEQAEILARHQRNAYRIEIAAPKQIELTDTVDPLASWKASRVSA